jgi:hypothetical protein
MISLVPAGQVLIEGTLVEIRHLPSDVNDISENGAGDSTSQTSG